MKSRKRYQSSFLTKRSERKAKRKLLYTVIFGAILLYFLFTWLLPNLIGSLSFLNQYKPRPQKEIPVVDKATLAPPVLNIPFEATNSAFITIKGYAAPATTVEIYLDGQLTNSAKTIEDGSFIFENFALNLGSNTIHGQTVGEKEKRSFPSKPITITYNNEKPKLELQSPEDNQVFSGENNNITISGSTSANEAISVEINGARVIIDSTGKFSKTIKASEGDNEIIVTASDTAGNTTQITKKVTYQSLP